MLLPCSPRCIARARLQHAHLFHRSASSAALPSDSSATSASSDKGKGRQSTLSQQYRYPETGKMGGPPNPYEVMALDPNASQQDVKQQYYKLALLLHPDSSHPSSSPDHFDTLNKAYNLLSKPSSRSAYSKTGYGWDLASSSSSPGPSSVDQWMRAEIHRRRTYGAAAWNPASRNYRNSDAGKGAWGGFDGSKGWKPYESKTGFEPPRADTGAAEERYMSNPRFLAVVGLTSVVVAYFNWSHVGGTSEAHREMLDRQHFDASHSLATARYEASTHGRIRRERIRRRVRQAEVMKELELAEQGHLALAEQGQFDSVQK
ncbi:hypothetical protein B9479_003011 [Cryptococcus floricola]|uniref:J domain-containing protein n=1 Tax=Cryptococcus floricola TaxID=2591691 RepID=A0A5D3B1I7_9TREE|nr:hypothetical protein B9479_003011 [Cryptococcus floricola]